MGRLASKEENLHRIMHEQNINLENMIFVGDDQPDSEAACNVGCEFIDIGTTADRFEIRPDLLITDLNKLCDVIIDMDQ